MKIFVWILSFPEVGIHQTPGENVNMWKKRTWKHS